MEYNAFRFYVPTQLPIQCVQRALLPSAEQSKLEADYLSTSTIYIKDEWISTSTPLYFWRDAWLDIAATLPKSWMHSNPSNHFQKPEYLLANKWEIFPFMKITYFRERLAFFLHIWKGLGSILGLATNYPDKFFTESKRKSADNALK
jgi:hypothetical protein